MGSSWPGPAYLTVGNPPLRGWLRDAPSGSSVGVDQTRFEEALQLQIVHEIVSVIRGLMTRGALRFAQKQILSAHSASFALAEFSFPVTSSLRRREIEQFLKFRHEMNLAAALTMFTPFFVAITGSPSK